MQAQAECHLQECSLLLLSVASHGSPRVGPRVWLIAHQRNPSLCPCWAPLSQELLEHTAGEAARDPGQGVWEGPRGSSRADVGLWEQSSGCGVWRHVAGL